VVGWFCVCPLKKLESFNSLSRKLATNHSIVREHSDYDNYSGNDNEHLID